VGRRRQRIEPAPDRVRRSRPWVQLGAGELARALPAGADRGRTRAMQISSPLARPDEAEGRI
jgi:hypothetical protein